MKYLSEVFYIGYWILIASSTKLLLAMDFGVIEHYVLVPGHGMLLYSPIILSV